MTQTKANGEIVRNVADKMTVTFPLVLTDTVSVSTFAESKRQNGGMISSCIFAIFENGTAYSCIIAIFLRFGPI